eukprot:7389570-Prymnesium_polylepis.1
MRFARREKGRGGGSSASDAAMMRPTQRGHTPHAHATSTRTKHAQQAHAPSTRNRHTHQARAPRTRNRHAQQAHATGTSVASSPPPDGQARAAPRFTSAARCGSSEARAA